MACTSAAAVGTGTAVSCSEISTHGLWERLWLGQTNLLATRVHCLPLFVQQHGSRIGAGVMMSSLWRYLLRLPVGSERKVASLNWVSGYNFAFEPRLGRSANLCRGLSFGQREHQCHLTATIEVGWKSQTQGLCHNVWLNMNFIQISIQTPEISDHGSTWMQHDQDSPETQGNDIYAA